MIGIIGAGLTGLATAFYLKKEFVIFEKENEPGGHSRTFNHKGFLYDFGGHFLHLRNDWVKNLVTDELGIILNSHSRHSAIFLNGVYGDYPFQNNLQNYPEDIIVECLEGLARAKFGNRKKAIQTFEDYILATMGEGIAKHFMVPYNTKLWSLPPSEMTVDWMGRFVPEPQFTQALRNLLKRKSVAEGYNKDFYYPEENGIGTIPEALALKVSGIKYNTEIQSIDMLNKQVRLSDGSIFKYSGLVNTMPLPELIVRSENVPEPVREAAGMLNWTNITICNLSVTELNIGFNWVYVPESKFPFFRFGNYSKVAPNKDKPETSNLYVEFSGGKARTVIPSADDVIDYLKEMKALRRNAQIIESMILPVKYAYVVYDKYRGEAVRTIQEYLISNDVYSVGRFGNWEYSSMEDAFIHGRKTAETLNQLEKG